jgi:hypothetical protein
MYDQSAIKMHEAFLQLEPTPTDDAEFLDLVSGVLANLCSLSGEGRLHVVHIDNWFGNRWLQFSGKVCGAMGIHDAADEMRIPPFHPHRVLSEHHCTFDGEGFSPLSQVNQCLHGPRGSHANTRIRLADVAPPGVYAWYSSRTREAKRGALMVYTLWDGETAGWFCLFEKNGCWRAKRRFGISETEWDAISPAVL